MRVNKTKAKLKAGETVVGCFMRYPVPSLVEICAYQGWDFMIFDAEHGLIDPATCECMVRAAELHGVTPLVRVPNTEPSTILRFLDIGVQGIHAPNVGSAAQAAAIVRSVKYHPVGVRGLAGTRAAGYGQEGPLRDYIERANQETMVIAQIESREGVDNVEKILEVDHIDVAFIGPTDLAHSLGVLGQPDHPVLQEALQRIEQSAAQSPAALGVWVGNAEGGVSWKSRGASYIATSMEPLLVSASRAYVNTLRAAAAGGTK
jgi:4-hydroxy-2-oxoheptanedioate aldolase